MTHRQLLRELGPGEIAYWAAVFERQHERTEQARKEASQR